MEDITLSSILMEYRIRAIDTTQAIKKIKQVFASDPVIDEIRQEAYEAGIHYGQEYNFQWWKENILDK
jgi:hypothetical protein